MKTSLLGRWFAALAAAGLLACGAASAAEVQVMISSGFHGVDSDP